MTTLEWSVDSPPVHHNFDEIPVVLRGPHEFANPEVLQHLGRDWIGQSELLPAGMQEPLGADVPNKA